jgi:hypothetical protein
MNRKQEKWIKPKSPVAVELYDSTTRKYSYIDELEDIPTKKTIQMIFVPSYGPGKYRVTDSTSPESQTQVWTVAEDLRADHTLAEEGTPYAPAPAPGLTPEQITERAVAAALEQMNRYRPPAPQAYASPPQHMQAPPQQSGPDPYTADIMRRVDTAIHQMQSQVMNLENQISRIMFEIQQVPTRVGIDVRAAVQDAGDPEERVANLWAMLQDMQEGNIVGEDSTPSWLKALAPALGAIGAPQMAAPLAALPEPNGQNGIIETIDPGPLGPLNSIQGIDPERAEAITVLCQMLGQPIEIVPKMAAQYSMSADDLIAWGKEQVRAAQAAQAAQPQVTEIEGMNDANIEDGNRPGAGESAGRSDPNGAKVGEASPV